MRRIWKLGRQLAMNHEFSTIKRFFGFTRSGTSLVGKVALRLFSRRETRYLVRVGLCVSATVLIASRVLANTGGNLILAYNAPLATIDTTTIPAVQKPFDFQYESRGVSWYHAGADLVGPTGTPVKPVMAGTVREVNTSYFGFGKHIIVESNGNYEAIYAHLSEIEVETGQTVSLNTKLGEVGSTGFSTGPHLHLEIHQNGQLVNPADIVPGVK